MERVYYIDGNGELCFSNIEDGCVSLAIEESPEFMSTVWHLSIFDFKGPNGEVYIAALRSSEAYHIFKLVFSKRFIIRKK